METKSLNFRSSISPTRFLSVVRGLGGLLILLFSLSLQAQTLDDYIIQAAENNPGLKASYARYEAAMERINQPGLPDPELQAGFFFRPMERFMGNQQADIRLMQMFPWFGMISTQKEEANYMAQAQYQLFLEEKNQLLYQVKSTWYEMIRLNEEVRISQENLEFLKKYERLALIKYQAAAGGSSSSSSSPMSSSSNSSMSSTSSGGSGMASMSGGNTSSSAMSQTTSPSTSMSSGGMSTSGSSMSDILQIRISIKELENTIAQQIADLEPLQIKFNQLLNREISEEIMLPTGFVPIQLDAEKLTVLDSIQANNPMLAMYDSEFSAYEQQAKMAKLDGRPMLGAGVNYMPFTSREENGMMMGGRDMVMPMVSLSLPIYRKKINSRVKEAELLQEATVLEKEKIKNLLAMEWANAYRDWENAERKIQLYGEQRDLTNQNLNLLITAYSADGRDFEEILRAQQQLLNYQLLEISAINMQHQSLAKLEMLSSSSIPLN
ncbi:outer membrane efflux protein [Algoriphagus boseongensis]|uniref:Outer membrane efflux protein n=1 Tax=Algoriphagus boseongensis TaxID=1442587 RepID=A0A4R6T8B7_9BACT|nr:TolC family protein [Algoriphagus boseongensis]TDQ18951.1 outer membrane efflux protein [Algoriphagus boseongensis]